MGAAPMVAVEVHSNQKGECGMSHHTPQHCKPLTDCYKVFDYAKAYVRFHKRFRWLLWFLFYVFNVATLVLIHEWMVHLGIATAFQVFDGFILAVEE
jgi:hypothetical protein